MRSQIWTPTASVPSLVAGGASGPETSDILDAMEANQRRLCRTRETLLYDFSLKLLYTPLFPPQQQ